MRKLDYLRNRLRKCKTFEDILAIKLPDDFNSRFGVSPPIVTPYVANGKLAGVSVVQLINDHNNEIALFGNVYKFAIKEKFKIQSISMIDFMIRGFKDYM